MPIEETGNLGEGFVRFRGVDVQAVDPYGVGAIIDILVKSVSVVRTGSSASPKAGS
jgi:hypothetical protein